MPKSGAAPPRRARPRRRKPAAGRAQAKPRHEPRRPPPPQHSRTSATGRCCRRSLDPRRARSSRSSSAGCFLDWKDQCETLDMAAGAKKASCSDAVRAEEGEGDQLRALRPAAERGRAVVRRAGQAAAQPLRDRRAADRHQPGRASAAACSSSCSSRPRRSRWPTSTPSCRSTIKITGNYHDMGAFASDVAQLPRIVTLNDVAHRQRQGHAAHGCRSPRRSATSTRKRSRSSARSRSSQGQGEQEMKRVGRTRSSLARGRRARRRLRRREPPGPARLDGASRARARGASSTRCRRSSPTSRSRTTRSTCPIRSSRARSSRTKGGSKLAPDLTRRKEPLEAFPLESLAMVGTLDAGTRRCTRSCARPTRTSTRCAPATTWDRTSASSPASATARSS